MSRASTSRRSASTRSFGTRPSPTSPVRSSRCKTRSSPRFARRSRTGLSVWRRSLLQHPDLAAEQLEHAVKRLGLRGALIGGSVNGEELSDPKFHPFWAKAEQLGVLIFIHPQGTAELNTSGRLKGQRRAGQRDRQPARDDDRSVASDLRGNARCLSRAEDLRRACRRISALLCRPVGSRLRDLPRSGAPRRSRRSRPNT